jgi:mRNA interferase RelE/StbE
MPKNGAADSPEFRIFETEEFSKALSQLGPPRFLLKKLETYVYPQLRQGPYFGPNIRKLQGYRSETWRYRIGPYRVFYSVDAHEKIVSCSLWTTVKTHIGKQPCRQKAILDRMKFGAVREMHQPKAAGTAITIGAKMKKRITNLSALIVDPLAVKKAAKSGLSCRRARESSKTAPL